MRERSNTREAASSYQPYTGYTRLALILVSIEVHVIEYLACDIGAVERGVRYQTHCRHRLFRHRATGQRAECLRAIHKFAFGNGGSDSEQ